MRGLVRRSELGGLVVDLDRLVPELIHLNEGGLKLQEQQRLLAGCQNGVAIPWAKDRIEDPNFPSVGPVYQEGAKQFVGLAGESRNFDANGQYVRSLAQNANYASVLGDGRFFFSALPIQGVNPPKAANGLPPYRPDVPCETQERPDLRTVVQPAPQQIRIDQDAPGAAARRDRARAEAMDWMRDQLKAGGLTDHLALSPTPLRPRRARRRPADPRPGGGPMKAIRDHARDFVAILALFTVGAVCAIYIVQKQRLRVPFIDETPFVLKAEFSTAQAITPGQGQTVRIAGIRIGDIAGTELRDGRAIVTMELDQKYKRLVHTDATRSCAPRPG